MPQRFRTPELLPLGSRIKTRLTLSPLTPEELTDYLQFALQQAGAPQLITQELVQTMATHEQGNMRVLTGQDDGDYNYPVWVYGVTREEIGYSHKKAQMLVKQQVKEN